MDRYTSYEDRLKRVEEVIVELGLKECENTAIGIAGKMTGISGGEAKRLAFASELITNPSLMFCDEPTSGLDSFMSRSVISVLREMARGGRTIVCVIHQPSSEVYELFDHLLLMADGRVAYKGESSKALEFFERAGLHCPVNYNPADFFIDSLAIDPGNETQCREKVMALCNQFAKEQTSLEINSFGIAQLMDEQLKPLTRYKASWWAQFRAVIWRSWISLIREPLLINVRLGQSVLVALIFGVIYLNQKVDEKGVMNINGANFFILMNLAFQNLFCVINAFVGEQPLFLREHWNGMYRTDVYFISKSIVEAPLLILASFLFVVITYWMIGFNPDPAAFINNAIIHTLIINTSASFGYMISCVSDSLNVALSLASPMLLPLVLFGGFYLNEGSIPIYFVWLKYISWFYYGNEALAINQWANIKNITCETQQCPTDGPTVLKMLNFHEENYVRDIVALVALLVVIRVLAFLLLLLKSSTKT